MNKAAERTFTHPDLIRLLAISVFLEALLPYHGKGQVETSQYDNARTGAYLQEHALTPKNVNARQFGKIGVLPADGEVYAQPLYVPAVNIPGKGVHDVLYVATASDSVYAFDATGHTTIPLWSVSFANPLAGIAPVSSDDLDCHFIRPDVGVVATPVIDVATNTIYVLARTKERDHAGVVRFWQRLHALDTRSGREKLGGPIVISGSVNGSSSLFGLIQNKVEFSPLLENPRAGLSLVADQVVLAWGSSCDNRPYHGWVMTYDAHSLKQTGVFNTSPDSGDGGIWQSDTTPAADHDGNVFVLTGNGVFTASAGGRSYGDSVLKLKVTKNGLSLRDFFTPFNEEEMNRNDLDLGSGGPMLIPPQPPSNRTLLITAGKGDAIYVLDPEHLGGYNKADNHQILQTLHDCGSGAYAAPAYWNGSVYYLCSGTTLKQFSVHRDGLRLERQANQAEPFTGDGATPTVSGNGIADGIVWAIECHQPKTSVAILHAYDASDVSRPELYNSNQWPRDYAGRAVRFAIPTVANGRVYVGAEKEIDVYGKLATPRSNNQRP